jgi:hypothetical protein
MWVSFLFCKYCEVEGVPRSKKYALKLEILLERFLIFGVVKVITAKNTI